MSIFVTIRGEEEELEFRDHGYEPDTNAHEIDWWFVSKELNESLTDAEQEWVDEYLHKLVSDPRYHDD